MSSQHRISMLVCLDVVKTLENLSRQPSSAITRKVCLPVNDAKNHVLGQALIGAGARFGPCTIEGMPGGHSPLVFQPQHPRGPQSLELWKLKDSNLGAVV
jgi:hypothetical protein